MDARDVIRYTLLLDTAPDVETLIDAYRAAIGQVGMHYFILTGLPASGQRFDELILERCWPEDWMEHYLERDYVRRDPVAITGASCTNPFTWRDAARRAGDIGPIATRIMGEAADAGLKDGFCVPVVVRNSRTGCISLAGERSGARREVLDALTILSVAFSSRLQLLWERQQDSAGLTSRERDVLQWVSKGKSSWDISRILSISESTVNKHTNNAMRKLASVSRSQAAARATALKEISACLSSRHVRPLWIPGNVCRL